MTSLKVSIENLEVRLKKIEDEINNMTEKVKGKRENLTKKKHAAKIANDELADKIESRQATIDALKAELAAGDTEEVIV